MLLSAAPLWIEIQGYPLFVARYNLSRKHETLKGDAQRWTGANGSRMDDQRTNREGGGSISTEPRRYARHRFSLKSLMIFVTMFAFCASTYLAGRSRGI